MPQTLVLPTIKGPRSSQAGPSPFPARDPLTDRWIRLAMALARATKKSAIGTPELAAALESAGLLAPLGIPGPRRRPGWYMHLCDLSELIRIPLDPGDWEALPLGGSVPESARQMLDDRAPIIDCFIAILIADDPIFSDFFGHLVQPDMKPSSRLQEAHACALSIDLALRKTVVGQSEAIESLRRLAFARVLRQDPTGPPATALFLGPPGVGKSYLARHFAEALAAWSSRSMAVPVLTVEMTQHLQWAGAGDLFGDGRKPGSVTSFVMENPACIVIVNELEKGHRKVLESFLPALDQGAVVVGADGKRVEFGQVIFVFTSNLGSEFWDRPATPEAGSLQVDPMELLGLAERPDERTEWFKTPIPKELLSRLSKGAIVLFRRHHGHHLYQKIVGSFGLRGGR